MTRTPTPGASGTARETARRGATWRVSGDATRSTGAVTRWARDATHGRCSLNLGRLDATLWTRGCNAKKRSCADGHLLPETGNDRRGSGESSLAPVRRDLVARLRCSVLREGRFVSRHLCAVSRRLFLLSLHSILALQWRDSAWRERCVAARSSCSVARQRCVLSRSFVSGSVRHFSGSHPFLRGRERNTVRLAQPGVGEKKRT